MLVTVTALKPRHNSDNELIVITDLYLTENRMLMVSGHCSKCLKDINILIPLSVLYDECPQSATYTETDANRLHGLGILPEPCQDSAL